MSFNIPYYLKNRRKRIHRSKFCYGQRIPLWKYSVRSVYHCCFFIRMQNLWPYGNNLLWRILPENTLKTCFPYTAKPVIIIRFFVSITDIPADNTLAEQAALAVSDLSAPFMEMVLLSHHGCF